MFAPSRSQAREFLFETWRKYRQAVPLAGLETVALEVILAHPEYHRYLEDREKYLERDFPPELGATNPFLHLALHLALEEQLSIDQPPGIAARFAALVAREGSRHDALHAAMDCLAETIWRAQRDGAPPDAAVYLQCLEKRPPSRRKAFSA
jgi:hypothetical protein